MVISWWIVAFSPSVLSFGCCTLPLWAWAVLLPTWYWCEHALISQSLVLSALCELLPRTSEHCILSLH